MFEDTDSISQTIIQAGSIVKQKYDKHNYYDERNRNTQKKLEKILLDHHKAPAQLKQKKKFTKEDYLDESNIPKQHSCYQSIVAPSNQNKVIPTPPVGFSLIHLKQQPKILGFSTFVEIDYKEYFSQLRASTLPIKQSISKSESPKKSEIEHEIEFPMRVSQFLAIKKQEKVNPDFENVQKRIDELKTSLSMVSSNYFPDSQIKKSRHHFNYNDDGVERILPGSEDPLSKLNLTKVNEKKHILEDDKLAELMNRMENLQSSVGDIKKILNKADATEDRAYNI